MRAHRGFTIAEVLTVMVIVALMLGAVAFAMPIILKGPLEAQSQVDNVQQAALALYKIQRDTRQSRLSGIFNCSVTPVVACSPQGGQATSTQALVIVTADNGSGQFKVDTGSQNNGATAGDPKWQGFIVYWLSPNADGTSNDLKRAFFPLAIASKNNGAPIVAAADAVTALTIVLAVTGAVTVAQDVRSISAAEDSTTGILALRVDGGTTSGNLSSMSLSGNTYVRN